MPNHIKGLLSVAVLIVGFIVFYLDQGNTDIEDHVRWVVLLLAVLMVGAIWVFPEAGKKDAADLRKANDKRTK